jgi:ribonuclease HI
LRSIRVVILLLRKNIKKEPFSKWECPPSGRLKINVDGAYRADGEVGGIGMVVRDGGENCLVAFACHIPYAASAIQMEVEACRAGLFIAIQQGWDELELESDCALLISALIVSSVDRSEFGRIVDDCKCYLDRFNSFQVRHIYREANGVVHCLGHIASLSNIDKLWLDETSSITENVLFEDSFNCARGSGDMSSSMHTSFLH